ncbi:MAG TPA: hypothetical protein VK646_00695 [Actinomycetota bacterium]|nr:hypothetical protein [Actinomycetota bacterium]
MQAGKWVRVSGLVLAAAIVGYLVGPPLAQAASNLVTVKDPKTAQKARVTAGSLWTDASGSLVYTQDAGNTVILSATGSGTKSGKGELSGISLDVPVTNGVAATLTVRKGITLGAGSIIWQGTVDGGSATGHLEAALNGSIYVASGFNVSVTADGGATVHYVLEGVGFGVPFNGPVRTDKPIHR